MSRCQACGGRIDNRHHRRLAVGSLRWLRFGMTRFGLRYGHGGAPPRARRRIRRIARLLIESSRADTFSANTFWVCRGRMRYRKRDGRSVATKHSAPTAA